MNLDEYAEKINERYNTDVKKKYLRDGIDVFSKELLNFQRKLKRDLPENKFFLAGRTAVEIERKRLDITEHSKLSSSNQEDPLYVYTYITGGPKNVEITEIDSFTFVETNSKYELLSKKHNLPPSKELLEKYFEVFDDILFS